MAKPKAKPEAEPEEPRGLKINKYGFLHINGNLAKHLGVEFGKDKGKDVPVTIELIQGGFVVKLKV